MTEVEQLRYELGRITRERDEWHARTAEAVKLRRERDEYQKVLEWYANEDHWEEVETVIGMVCSDAECDAGYLARQILRKG